MSESPHDCDEGEEELSSRTDASPDNEESPEVAIPSETTTDSPVIVSSEIPPKPVVTDRLTQECAEILGAMAMESSNIKFERQFRPTRYNRISDSNPGLWDKAMIGYVSRISQVYQKKAIREVLTMNDEEHYIAVGPDACTSCREGKGPSWDCTVARFTDTGKERSTAMLVGAKCAMCTSQHCSLNALKDKPIEEKQEILARWKSAAPGLCAAWRQKVGIKTSISPADKSERDTLGSTDDAGKEPSTLPGLATSKDQPSNLAAPPSPAPLTSSTSALQELLAETSPSFRGTVPVTVPNGEFSTNIEYEDNDIVLDLDSRDELDFSIPSVSHRPSGPSGETLEATSSLPPAIPDRRSSSSLITPTSSSHPLVTPPVPPTKRKARSSLLAPISKTARQSSPPSPHDETLPLLSMYTPEEVAGSPDLPYYRIPKGIDNILVEKSGVPRSSWRDQVEMEADGRDIIHPAVARMYPTLTRIVKLDESSARLLVSLSDHRYEETRSSAGEVLGSEVAKNKKRRLCRYLYGSSKKCIACSASPSCVFGSIKPPSPSDVSRGLITLGSCIRCTTTGRQCFFVAKQHDGTFHFDRAFARRTSSVPLRFPLLSARVSNGKPDKKLEMPCTGPSMIWSLIHRCRDPGSRIWWEQAWRDLAPLGRSLAAALMVPPGTSFRPGHLRPRSISPGEEEEDEGDTADTTIHGTFLGVDLAHKLEVTSIEACLRSEESYDVDLVMALLQRAATSPSPSHSLSSRTDRHLYPGPLCLHVDTVTGPRPSPSDDTLSDTISLVVGVSIQASRTRHLGSVFGTWIIAPAGRIIATFGIDLMVESFADPITALNLAADLSDWTREHYPFPDDQECHSGPMSVEIGKLALQAETPYLRPQIWQAMLSLIPDPAELRAFHLSQLEDDCELSKRIFKHLQDGDEEDIQAALTRLSLEV